MKQFRISGRRDLFSDIGISISVEGLDYGLHAQCGAEENGLLVLLDGDEDKVRSFYEKVKQSYEQRGYSASSLEPYQGPFPNWREYRESLNTALGAKGVETLENMTETLPSKIAKALEEVKS